MIYSLDLKSYFPQKVLTTSPPRDFDNLSTVKACKINCTRFLLSRELNHTVLHLMCLYYNDC